MVKSNQFDKEEYLRYFVVKKLKAYTKEVDDLKPRMKNVRPMKDGSISYETLEGENWKRKRLEKEQIQELANQLWSSHL